MGLEDKDFIIRQVQQLAEGVGKFLGKESIKEFINYDQTQEDALSDDDIESILLMTNIKEIQERKQLTNQGISRELGITENELDKLYNSERFATSSELIALRDFVEKNDSY